MCKKTRQQLFFVLVETFFFFCMVGVLHLMMTWAQKEKQIYQHKPGADRHEVSIKHRSPKVKS